MTTENDTTEIGNMFREGQVVILPLVISTTTGILLHSPKKNLRFLNIKNSRHAEVPAGLNTTFLNIK